MGTHYTGTEAEVRALDLYIKLTRAADAVNGRINRHLADENLTISQFGVLEALYHLGPLHQHELAEKILKSTGNMTLVLDNLAKRELVERCRDEEDRRYVTVHLTEDGRALIARMFPNHVATVVAEMAVLSAAEQEQLAALCRRLGRQETAEV
ncbi:MAG: MarR family transcriptional regulator [Anaerolineales bacterium]|nr:MarR family transcriptional regulator [Anaerolineales bacterium]